MELDTLRNLATGFRAGIEQARADGAAGALPYVPDGACRLTSRLFALHLTRRAGGVGFVSARLVSGVLPQSNLGARHYWLELDDAVVDLTADAFGQPPVVVGATTSFHHSLMGHVTEAAGEHLASLSADELARLTRQLAAIEQRMPRGDGYGMG